MVGVFGAAAGAAFGRRGHKGAVRRGAVAAVVAVGGNEQGNLAVFLEQAVLQPGVVGVQVLPAQAAHVALGQQALDVVLVDAGHGFQDDEQLAELFVQRHAGDGVLDPLDLFLVEIKRFCFQIDHNFLLEAFTPETHLEQV